MFEVNKPKERKGLDYTYEDEKKGYVTGLIVAASAITLLASAAVVTYLIKKED